MSVLSAYVSHIHAHYLYLYLSRSLIRSVYKYVDPVSQLAINQQRFINLFLGSDRESTRQRCLIGFNRVLPFAYLHVSISVQLF